MIRVIVHDPCEKVRIREGIKFNCVCLMMYMDDCDMVLMNGIRGVDGCVLVVGSHICVYFVNGLIIFVLVQLFNFDV